MPFPKFFWALLILPIILFSSQIEIFPSPSLERDIANTPATTSPPNGPSSDAEADPNDCLKYLPPDAASLLDLSDNQLGQVENGLISAADAGRDLFFQVKKSTQGNTSSEAVVAAMLATTLEGAKQNLKVFLMSQVASGAPLSPSDREILLRVFSEGRSANPESDLQAAATLAAPHFANLKSNGATIDKRGWNFTKFNWATLKNNSDLQKSFFVFYPESEEDVKNWGNSTRPHLIHFGKTILLPGGHLISSEQYQRQAAFYINLIQRDFGIYEKAAQVASSFRDQMTGRMRERKPEIYQNALDKTNSVKRAIIGKDDKKKEAYDDSAAKTPAEIEKEGAYNAVLSELAILENHLVFDPQVVKQIRLNLVLALANEGEALDKTFATVARLQKMSQVLAIAGAVSGTILASMLYPPAAQVVVSGAQAVGLGGGESFVLSAAEKSVFTSLTNGFAAIYGTALLTHAASAGIQKLRVGGSYLCLLSDQLAENTPTDLFYATLFSPLGFVRPQYLMRVRILGKILPEASARLATKVILGLIGIPGLVVMGQSFWTAGKDQISINDADQNGEKRAAESLRVRRDQELLTGFEALAFTGALWRIGKAFLKVPIDRVALRQSAEQLGSQPASDFKNPQQALDAMRVLDRSRTELETSLDHAKFNAWLTSKGDAILGYFKDSNKTSGEVLIELEKEFDTKSSMVTFRTLAKNLGFAAAAADVTINHGKQVGSQVLKLIKNNAKKLYNAGTDAIILGQTMRFLGAYTDGPGTQLEAFARKYGNKNFSWLADDEAIWIKNFDDYHGGFQKTRDALVAQMSQHFITPLGTSKEYDDYIHYFQGVTAKFNQVANNAKDGQNTIFGGTNDLLNLENIASVAYHNYLSDQDRVAALVEIQKTKALTPLQTGQLSQYEDLMKADLSQTIGAVATYKVRSVLFQEAVLKGGAGDYEKVQQIFERIIAAQTDGIESLTTACDVEMAQIIVRYQLKITSVDTDLLTKVKSMHPELLQ